jgi:ectoine hydroxylase-related dioxygenase (phytanoyl-CoA dioxygenase family)
VEPAAAPHPELQVASLIAMVDFVRDNGATRLVPGSQGEQLPRSAARSREHVAPRVSGLLGYAVHDAIATDGGNLGMLDLRDPLEILDER